MLSSLRERITRSELGRTIKDMRAKAEQNRSFSPIHPTYLRQLRRDRAKGLIIGAAAIAAGVASLNYAAGAEERSNKRAESECNTVGCQENLRAQDIQKGIDPDHDTRIPHRPTFREMKMILDAYNYEEDLKRLAVSAAETTVAGLVAVGAGIYLRRLGQGHRARLQALRGNKITPQLPRPQI